MRAYGKGFEEFYNRVRDEGVKYIRRDLDKPIKVEREGEGDILSVTAENEEKKIKIEADLVVLASCIVPNKGAKEIIKLLKITQSADNFLLEAHPKLRPVETATDGIFLAGCCQGPKDIPDSVAQACGAAEAASIPLFQGKVEVEAITSSIDDEICSGCRSCESVCVYGALSFDEEEGVMTVNDVLCKGCGSCGSTCPSGAISMNHFKDVQIYAQMGAMI
jgi:heterodisulfide reductase subunit A